MSDGEFAYNHFTLDELRSLAASPQVGTMQAMPQSFRALADRVGEVADLLTHAQADLPNWWKGPAADHAAATLGRAAAEAREFQGSALTAASTVSRCAQVVAEQQHQMMNVPELPEPGITDVVQRPKTPFEALEAARQDARYQAAHEQAVQVVTGIAAQYVETRDALALITTMHGENFVNKVTTPDFLANSKEPLLANSGSNTEYQRINSTGSYEQKHGPSPRSPAEGETTTEKPREVSQPAKAKSISSRRQQGPMEPQASAPPLSSSSNLRNPESIEFDRTPVSLPSQQEKADEGPISDYAESGLANNVFTPDEQITRPTYREVNRENSRLRNQTEQESRDTLPQRQLKRSRITSAYDDRLRVGERIPLGRDSTPRPIDASADSPPSIPSEIAHGSQVDGTVDNSSAIIPPYSGVGHLGRAREERNRRPPYLKERKNTWLPDTRAAPADGVIRPEVP